MARKNLQTRPPVKKRGQSTTDDTGSKSRWLDLGRSATIMGFALFGVIIVCVCFLGLSPAGPQILPNQVSRIRIVSNFDFTFESDILTEKLREKRRLGVTPVYRIEMSHYNEFSRFIDRLQPGLAELDSRLGQAESDMRMPLIGQFINEYTKDTPYRLNAEDLDIFLSQTTPAARSTAIHEGLMIMRDIYAAGIYDRKESDTGGLRVLSVQRSTGHISEADLQTKESALRNLRINLSPLEINREASVALYRLLRVGLQSNLEYDAESTQKAIDIVVASVTPVMVTVEEGQTIIEPNERVTLREVEELGVYRKLLSEREGSGLDFGPLLWERLVITTGILAALMLALKAGGSSLRSNHRKFLLSAAVIIVNMALIRLTVELGESRLIGQGPNPLYSVLPFLAPVALGPMIVAILLGAGAGISVALVVGILYALMLGNSMGILIMSFLSALVGIYSCRGIQVRGRVVRAGFYSGLAMALCAFFLGLRDTLDAISIAEQMGVAAVVGTVTGIAVVGLLPSLEHIFKYTSDITLLELTDFNHPLLRRMQMVAPGSYHHSLMVANLAERAAAEVGANPLACRVCSLFHDIGKMVKPEYFTENQLGMRNPHLEKNPSMSALIIKAHVKEGSAMARKIKLPKVIVDVIEQHHGTTLIQYFYYKALREQEEKRRNITPAVYPGAPAVSIDEVNESTYRYEGPKPQFKESAVIFLADSIEAASRSLKKVTPQAVDELVDGIFRSRLDDRQLDECPLTFEDMCKIRESFCATLLSMLHTRIEYPESDKKGAGKQPRDGEQKPARQDPRIQQV